MSLWYCAFIRNQPKQNLHVVGARKQAFINNQTFFSSEIFVEKNHKICILNSFIYELFNINLSSGALRLVEWSHVMLGREAVE